MKRCQRCGYLIEPVASAKEIVPFADSGAKPTLWLHPSDEACNEATLARRATATYTPRTRRYPA